MEKFIDLTIRWYKGRIENVEFTILDGLAYWREKIFNGLIFVFFVFGTLAIIPNLIASNNNHTLLITIADTLIYFLVCFLFFNKKVKLKLKIELMIASFYILSLILLVMLGPFGPGLVWLSSICIVAALLAGKKAAIHTIIVNTLVILVLAILIKLKILHTIFFESYTTLTWIAVSLNVILFTSISSIPIAMLIEGLEKMILNEKTIQQELEVSNAQIKVEMEHAKESDKLKSAFLANLSHEIRTPMNAIIGFSELIQMEDDKSPNMDKYSQYIIQNSVYLQNLINDIVDISLIESGQIRFHYEYTTLSKVFTELEPIIEAYPIRKKRLNVSITFECDEKLLMLAVFTDTTHLKQILINLITNSLKYTSEGFIKIKTQKVNSSLEFCVKDSGIGIPDNEKYKIFNRFTKIDRGGKVLVPGIGIGLSITKGLAEAMQGEIRFESEENRGTCFYLKLPYKPKMN